jgi:hypothetical protein
MTLVANFEIKGYPVFISDVLISSPDDTSAARVPTIGPIAKIFPEGSGYVPTDLRQKTAIIGSNVLVGWSGSALSARTYCTKLREVGHLEPLTLEKILRLTDELTKQSIIPELSVLGLVRDPNSSKVEPFDIPPYQSVESDAHGTIRVIGSGSDWFGAFLGISTPEEPHGPEANPTSVSLAGQAIAGACLGLEVENGFSLLEYFGGGYEVATLWPDGFKKLSGITTLVWCGQNFEPPVEFGLSHVSSWSYLEDFLRVQVWRSEVESKSTGDGSGRLTQMEPFLIEPVFRTSRRPAASAVSLTAFNSRIICNYFIIGEQGKRQCKAHIEFYEYGSPNIEFFDDAGSLGVRYNRAWMQNILNSIAGQQ